MTNVQLLGNLRKRVLIPLGMAVAISLVPPIVLAECRARAQEAMAGGKPASRVAAVVIIGIWLLRAALSALWAYEAYAATNQSSKVLTPVWK